MAYKITWSDEARVTYVSIIEYLRKEWTEREIINFVNSVHMLLNLLVLQPRVGAVLKKRKRIHKTMAHKYTTLVYHIKPREKEIILLTFWDTRQDPGKFKY